MVRPTPNPTAAPLPHDAVRNPPSADSLKMGTTVAVIAHVGLIAALAYGVAWKREEVTAISAELWAAVPQQAAPAAPPPPPPPPPPPTPTPAPVPPVPAVKPPPPPAPKAIEPPPPPAPREADIARERADKRRREAEEAEQQEKQAKLEQAKRDKAEKLAKEKEKTAKKEAAQKETEKEKEKEAERKAAEKAKETIQQEKTAKAREDNLKRLQKQLGEGGSGDSSPNPAPTATPGGGTAAQSSGPSAGYAGRLRAYLKPKLVYTGRNIGSTPAIVRVRVAPDGTIISRELIKSSGQADWDQAVLDAIDRASVVPRDTDNRVPPVIDIPWTASER